MRHGRNFMVHGVIPVTVIMCIPLLGKDAAMHGMFVGKNQSDYNYI